MITAQDARKGTFLARLRMLGERAPEIAQIAGQPVPWMNWAAECRKATTDDAFAAKALATLAGAAGTASQYAEAAELMGEALGAARSSGRQAVLTVIAIGAPALRGPHATALMSRTVDVLTEAEQWLSPGHSAWASTSSASDAPTTDKRAKS